MEHFYLGLLIGFNWVCFYLGPNWSCTHSNGWNSPRWVWIGIEWSSKKNDWFASSALLLFLCLAARPMSPTQFLSISSKWSKSHGSTRPIHTILLWLQVGRYCGNAALANHVL